MLFGLFPPGSESPIIRQLAVVHFITFSILQHAWLLWKLFELIIRITIIRCVCLN